LPVPREVSDVTALPLPVSYSDAFVSTPPVLRIDRAGTNILLAWPLSAGNYSLQEAAGALPPLGVWTNLSVTPSVSNNENVVTLPRASAARFYRLSYP
jgi:hypothetical protein